MSRVGSLMLVLALGACGGDDDAAADASPSSIDGASGPDAAGGSWVVYQAGDFPLASIEGVVMLSNFTAVTRAGGSWNLGTTSVAANVIHADESVLSHFYRSPDSRCV